jgi:Zn-dependent protease
LSLAAVIHWLNETSWSNHLRSSELAFPITEATHLIGLGISVGIVLWIDLRLLGVCLKRVSVKELVTRLEPWAMRGFVVMFISGLLLFFSKPDTYYGTWAFRVKMAALPLAGLNVLLFHKRVLPSIGHWDESGSVPWQAKLVGGVSIALWLAIMVLGRLTAYMADPLYSGF